MIEACSPPLKGTNGFGFQELLRAKKETPQKKPLDTAPIKKAVIASVPPKVTKLDFGLKPFFKRYSISIPKDLRWLLDFIRDPRIVEEKHVLKHLVHWVREAEKVFKDDIDARIFLAGIKFRLKVSLKCNEFEKRTRLSSVFVSEIEKLLQPDAPVVMPTMEGSNDIEKQFLSRVIGTYMKQYDRTIEHLTRRASAVSTAIMTIEPVAVDAAPPTFFPRAERSEGEKALINFKTSVSSSIGKLSKDKKKEVTKILCSKKSVPAMCSELRALMSEDADLLQQLRKFEAKHAEPKVKIEKPSQLYIQPSAVSEALAKLTIDIEEKDKAIKKLRADRLGLMQSRAEIKEQLLRKIPEENKKECVKQVIKMSLWDRICVAFGFKPTVAYLSKEAAANKSFDLSVAYDQINRGLASENEELIVRGVNGFFSDDSYQQLLKLSGSLFKNKNSLEENFKAICKCSNESGILLRKQNELEISDEELHAPAPVSPTSQALSQ